MRCHLYSNKKISILPGQISSITIEVSTENFGIVKLLRQLIKNKRSNSNWKLKLQGKSKDGVSIQTHSEEKSTVPVEEE